MPTRLIREGKNNSAAVCALSDSGQIFYDRLLLIVDDYGRIEADVDILRAKCFAKLLDRWPTERVRTTLDEVCNQPSEPDNVGQCPSNNLDRLVVSYRANNKNYLQVNNFGQRTRGVSKIPAPSDGTLSDIVSQSPPNSEAYAKAYAKAEAKAEAEASLRGETALELGERGTGQDFQAFRLAAEDSGMQASEPDWRIAHGIWKALDFEQKQKAAEGMLARKGTNDFVVIRGTPAGYLGGQKWQRPIRAPVMTSEDRKKAEFDKAFLELAEREVNRGRH